MLTIVGQFLLSSLVIVMAGSFLTKFADRIAQVTGWGRMFVGGLLLAGATSLPELLVDLKAVEAGLPNLAVGDLLGSSLFNLLILATLDFAFPSAFRGTAFSPKFLHHSLSAVLTIVLTGIIGVGIVARVEASFLGVGIFGWAVLGLYLFGLRLIYKDNNPQAVRIEGVPLAIKPLIAPFFGYFVSASVIFLAAPFLIEAADQMAVRSGLGHTFLGTTLVALATSLPELVATLTAFRMGAADLALGNVFGSNAFNMILFVPLDLAFPGVLFASVSPVHSVTAFAVVIATGIAVMGHLYRKIERSRFSEPSSELVVAVLLVFILLLYFLKH